MIKGHLIHVSDPGCFTNLDESVLLAPSLRLVVARFAPLTLSEKDGIYIYIFHDFSLATWVNVKNISTCQACCLFKANVQTTLTFGKRRLQWHMLGQTDGQPRPSERPHSMVHPKKNTETGLVQTNAPRCGYPFNHPQEPCSLFADVCTLLVFFIHIVRPFSFHPGHPPPPSHHRIMALHHHLR